MDLSSPPRYDVVVPTFREEAYIGNLLDALSQQTVKPHCVIVADYRSGEDGTAEIARKHGARVVAVQEPGIGNARKTGNYFTDSLCVLNIDADSRPAPNVAEYLLQPIIKMGMVATFAQGKWGYAWEKDELRQFEKSFFEDFFQFHKYFYPHGQCYSGLMVAKWAYEQIGGFRDVPWEDSDLSLRLNLGFPFRVLYVPRALTATSHRRHSGFFQNPFSLLDYSKAYRQDREYDV